MDMYEAFRDELEKKGVDREALGVPGRNPLPGGAVWKKPVNPQAKAAAPKRVVHAAAGHWPLAEATTPTSFSLPAPKSAPPAAPPARAATPVKLKTLPRLKVSSLEDLQLMFNAFMDEIEKTAIAGTPLGRTITDPMKRKGTADFLSAIRGSGASQAQKGTALAGARGGAPHDTNPREIGRAHV